MAIQWCKGGYCNCVSLWGYRTSDDLDSSFRSVHMPGPCVLTETKRPKKFSVMFDKYSSQALYEGKGGNCHCQSISANFLNVARIVTHPNDPGKSTV